MGNTNNPFSHLDDLSIPDRVAIMSSLIDTNAKVVKGKANAAIEVDLGYLLDLYFEAIEKGVASHLDNMVSKIGNNFDFQYLKEIYLEKKGESELSFLDDYGFFRLAYGEKDSIVNFNNFLYDDSIKLSEIISQIGKEENSLIKIRLFLLVISQKKGALLQFNGDILNLLCSMDKEVYEYINSSITDKKVKDFIDTKIVEAYDWYIDKFGDKGASLFLNQITSSHSKDMVFDILSSTNNSITKRSKFLVDLFKYGASVDYMKKVMIEIKKIMDESGGVIQGDISIKELIIIFANNNNVLLFGYFVGVFRDYIRTVGDDNEFLQNNLQKPYFATIMNIYNTVQKVEDAILPDKKPKN